jgi:hypothetical protein
MNTEIFIKLPKWQQLYTFGASGIFVNKEVAKNDMRRRASKFTGMSIVVSLTVTNK